MELINVTKCASCWSFSLIYITTHGAEYIKFEDTIRCLYTHKTKDRTSTCNFHKAANHKCYTFQKASVYHHSHELRYPYVNTVCRGSSIGIATRYGLDSPGIESRWGSRLSAPVQTCPGTHQASETMGTRSFPGVKRPRRGVDQSPPFCAEVKERVEIYLYSFPLWAFVVCSRVTFTFTC